jgi:hypothetical protein
MKKLIKRAYFLQLYVTGLTSILLLSMWLQIHGHDKIRWGVIDESLILGCINLFLFCRLIYDKMSFDEK